MIPTAMNKSVALNIGQIFPIILSIGKSVAIACYNDLLASELSFSVKRELEKEMLNVKAKYGKDGGISFGRIDVLPYSKWCEKYVKTAKLKLDKGISRGEYYDKILPHMVKI